MAGPIRSHVFGISAKKHHSYVDRGRLDRELEELLDQDKHIVIHGESKQGKTWLRERVLANEQIIRVQCQPKSTPASLLEEAMGVVGIRATLRYTAEGTLGGELDLTLAGELGVKLFARARAEGRIATNIQSVRGSESVPVGRTSADLAWVAFVLANTDKRVVLEDFHYLPSTVQRDLSFIFKALFEYRVFVVVVGVWAQDHLLNYYNGDLAGRVADIRIEWTQGELGEVLENGSRALNVSFSEELARTAVDDAFGNVGLLHRIADALCRQAGVHRRELPKKRVTNPRLIEESRQIVAREMGGRFLTFADRLADVGVIYEEMIQVLIEATDDELTAGLSLRSLCDKMNSKFNRKRAPSDLRGNLERISEKQSRLEIEPAVLAWDQSTGRLFLVDRDFLFFRRYGRPVWSWEEGGA